MAAKKACVIYVEASSASLKATTTLLEERGYSVCKAKADTQTTEAAQEGSVDLPQEIRDCMEGADLCVFLLPEQENGDGNLGTAASMAALGEIRCLGVVSGKRQEYPEALEDHASAMVREHSDRLAEAIDGREIWELPDKTLVPDRLIKHIICQ